MTEQDYLDLITPYFSKQPDFTAMISADVSPMVQVQALLSAMIPLFDLDTPPVGDQLDIIGLWAGITRNVVIPTTGIYFAWNSTAALGWNSGSWEPIPPPSEITSLPDDAYLLLIRAKIAANNWNGTTDGLYAIYALLFPDNVVLIQDYQNMTYAIGITGPALSAISIALLAGGYIPLRPEGVLITGYYFPVDANPAFAWDVENDNLEGWDEGSWLSQVDPT